MIDSERLFEMLGHRVADRQIIGEDEYQRVRSLERAVEQAHSVGRMKRYVARDPLSGEVVGYGYKREDVKRIIENGG